MTNRSEKNQSETIDEYLEAIYTIEREQTKQIKAVTLANYMSLTRASVSHELCILKEKGLIEMEDKFFIKLTYEGRERAMRSYLKNKTFAELLIKAGVEEERAKAEAALLRHAISFSSLEKLIAYLE